MTDPQVVREAVEGHLLREPDMTFIPVSGAIARNLAPETGPVTIQLRKRDDGLLDMLITEVEAPQ